MASLGCDIHAIHEGGDHWIVIGRVVAMHRSETTARPLMFFRGAYATLGEERALIAAMPSFEGIGW
jgi:3-hydroxy-9,10-secoandrosta-1,3,5(10)-triene-9,17-dione monooxygenase reductase component